MWLRHRYLDRVEAYPRKCPARQFLPPQTVRTPIVVLIVFSESILDTKARD
jgi:hypothetical protein